MKETNLFYYYVLMMLIKTIFIRAEWNEPYFLDFNSNITLQGFEGYQKIDIVEELQTPFVLAKINYNGKEKPLIGAFSFGDNHFLGAQVLQNNEGEWLVEITKRQDYENEHQRIYVFSINIRAEKERSIRVSLKNIFDNNPTVTYYPSPCKVEELKSNFDTECIFDVYDVDGMYQNNIKMNVIGQNIQTIFNLVEYGKGTEYSKRFVLRIIQELHYEQRAAYNLNITVSDANENKGFISAIIEVIDVPNKNPIWVKPLTTETFMEKTVQEFQVKAIDGDTGINKDIHYKLEFIDKDYSNLIYIDKTTGKLIVQPIDRDELDQDTFSFEVCAYKHDNESWSIKNVAVFVVQDINDHYPEINIEPSKIDLLENNFITLDLSKFIVIDKDFGINATYNLSISYKGDIMYSEAFDLIPTSGYKQTAFRINVKKASSLDYEDTFWREFTLEIKSHEHGNRKHVRTQDLKVNLVNWNDEKPIFSENTYVVSVYENAKAGLNVAIVNATDRDIDDYVEHYIVGLSDGMEMDKETGGIILLEDEIFDYERQKTVILQIMARDSLTTQYTSILNTAFTQLTINVVDVNDETPVLIMPKTLTNITENSLRDILVTSLIKANDPDTTANLKLEIIWEKSYATKGGQEAGREFYEGCFLLEKHEINTNRINGYLIVNPEFVDVYAIDYEKYDTIFLTLRVTDINQDINDGFTEDLLIIRVIDVNDNPPQFSNGTLIEKRKVTEEEELYTVIGSVAAFDIDGPGNNKIEFIIRPIGELTENGLVEVDRNTGVIRVIGIINCDIPKVEYLEYEVSLFDSVHITKGNIQIYIVDTNNKSPQMKDFEQQIMIYENAISGILIGEVIAHDADRDEPHNVLKYSLNVAGSSLIKQLFYVDLTNGAVYLNKKDGVELDRDSGIEYHLINIDVADNFDENNPRFGPSNHNFTFINVTLIDINDNAPQMPSKNQFRPQFFEQSLKDTLSAEKIIAIDNDAPNTPFSQISYEIVSIKPFFNNAENIENYDNIFGIQSDSNAFGQLVTQKKLRGYFGAWKVEIKAFDYGIPPMWNSSTYEVTVRPYNFNAPKIIFPIQDKPLRLSMFQEVGRPLIEVDRVSQIKLFQAIDPDGDIYGDVNFTLNSNNGDHEHFTIIKVNRSVSYLALRNAVKIGIYSLNVIAVDGDGKTSKEIENLRIIFVDMQGSPIFLDTEFETDFTENEDGLLERRIIPVAEDPKNQGVDSEIDIYKVYYFIDDSFNRDDANLFELNKSTRELRITQKLDRETKDVHIIRIAATNNEDGFISNANNKHFLTVTIKVNDVNDNAPIFNETYYAAGITIKDERNKKIVTYLAFDPDLNDSTTYMINNDTIQVEGMNIAQHKYNMFKLDNKTGELKLTTPVSNLMKGFFMFDVIAYDTANPAQYDTVSTKIYIIAESNKVKFVFLSDTETVHLNEKFIRKEFENAYAYNTCNIDDIDDIRNQNPEQYNMSAPITEVVAHFIHNDEAVEATEIQKKSNDLRFISKLQNSLQVRNLILNDVPHTHHDKIEENLQNLLITILIAITIILVVLCIILIIAFTMKTRALKLKLKAFEPPDFGSTTSNLNNICAPTTNIFSVEGSNLVINNKKNYNNSNIEDSGSKCIEQQSLESNDEPNFVGIDEDQIFAI